MKKTLIFCLLILSFSFARAQNTEDYIADRAEFAQTLMQDHHIPASLILAVAIHESASGKSKIAQYLNNHFGIKGPNTSTKIRSAYREYIDINESYNHFVEFLQGRSAFKKLFDKYDRYDYQGWARGIHRSGYAASRTWANQVIAIVKKYQLYQYDQRPDDYIEPTYAAPKTPKSTKSNFYVVKRGDNLSTIAKKKRTTVKSLMLKNKLKKNNLKPGQRLKV